MTQEPPKPGDMLFDVVGCPMWEVAHVLSGPDRMNTWTVVNASGTETRVAWNGTRWWVL